jgi:hypothetical protein
MRPEQITSLVPRPPEDLGAMAIVAQANVRQLQVTARKRWGGEEPNVPAPGAVLRFREALLDWQSVRSYEEATLLARLHELWGQYCVFCWVFGAKNPKHPPDFVEAVAGGDIRCFGEIGAKLIEVRRGLWRLRHEDRLRHDPAFKASPQFKAQVQAADDIPMLVFGKNVRVCSDEDLLGCTCEYAGMLAALRWMSDERWRWGQAGIMELDAEPS